MLRSTLLASVVLLAFLPTGAAHGTWTHCGATDVEAGGFYVVKDPAPAEMFVYQEMNLEAHLQRGDNDNLPLLTYTDPCLDVWINGPDKLVF